MRTLRMLAFLLTLLVVPGAALAGVADHLIISEVHYDPTNEDAEFVEVFNPTEADIVLNDGTASYFLTDEYTAYPNIVNGDLTDGSADWIVQFPVGTTIPAHSMLLLTGKASAFSSEYFAGNLQTFVDMPGAPQLFEFTETDATVANAIVRGTGAGMSLSNGGESLVLFYWDGASDLVQDVDYVAWASATYALNKSAVSIDGPDGDTTATAYATDAASGTIAADASGGNSIQRVIALEPNELTTAGNGITGHDESSEDWSSSFDHLKAATPGRMLATFDGDLADLMLISAPLAVSAADGPGANLSPADFGSDGTITELYAAPVDTTGDGVADTLWIGLRGEFFSTDDGNGTYVAIDAAPGLGNGLTMLDTAGSSASDVTGTLDIDITESGVFLGTQPLADAIAFDAVIGVTASGCAGDTCGLRGFGSDGVGGSSSDFAWLTATVAEGTMSAVPGATGTSYAATKGLEFAIPLSELGNPVVVALAAYTSADGATGDPSPNTLPENANDAFDATQALEGVVYVIIGDVCTSNADCGACEVCAGFLCAPVADTTVCDDGDLCTQDDVCTAGTCGGTAPDCSAQCLTGACDPSDGSCVVAADTTTCNDSNACTANDSCTGGVCNGASVTCDGACETSVCLPTSGCEPKPENDLCDDGNACTSGDVCTAGVCAGPSATSCTDLGDPCKVDTCNVTTGLCEPIAVADNTMCDDALACTENDVCTSGVCGGSAVDCTNLDDACNVGTCNATNGQCEAVTINEGGSCDDGVACTTGDVCNSGTCGGATVSCSNLDDTCNVGVCNATTGLCEAAANNEGGSCDDGLACTTSDVCASGTCGGAAVDCSNLDDTCNVGVCNATNGQCELSALADNTGCDDADPCTESDVCTAGACAGTPSASGTACGDQCNVGACNATTGLCESTPVADATPCDDGSACTTDDACTGGVCGGSAATDGTLCDDADLCTTDDSCTAGTCGGAAVDCTDLDDQCNIGTCDMATGSCEATPVADDTDCNDDNGCTEVDVCVSGVCEGAALADDTACDDGDNCTDGEACLAGLCVGGTDVCAEVVEGDDVAEPSDDVAPDVMEPSDDVASDTAVVPTDTSSTTDVAGDTVVLVEPVPDLKGGGCECSVRTAQRSHSLPLFAALFGGLFALVVARRRRR